MHQFLERTNIPVVLLVVFSLCSGLKSVHFWLHHHHEHKVCTDFQPDSKTAHVHDERYEIDDCAICAFIFSVPEFVSWEKKTLKLAIYTPRVDVFTSKNYHHRLPDGLKARGPPFI